MFHPLVILLIGVVTVIGMIVVLRVNAFLALITAAIVVSLLSPGPYVKDNVSVEVGELTNWGQEIGQVATDFGPGPLEVSKSPVRGEYETFVVSRDSTAVNWGMKIKRVAVAFGEAAGGIGIVIALAAIIGKCLMDSGAADRIVRSFLKLLGEKRAATALMGSGFVLSVPVFFDTTFYLLVPLARSLWSRTRQHYVLYLTAIAAGGAVTHTLVPPTPGPLYMATELNIDIGLMMIMGAVIGLPTAAVGLLVCRMLNRLMPLEMKPYVGTSELDPLDEEQLPSLPVSLAPVVLPVLLIAGKTVSEMLSSGEQTLWLKITGVLGDANLALLIAAGIAMTVLATSRRLTLSQLGKSVEEALLSGGAIVLITAGGGAFGKMLKAAGLQDILGDFVGAEGGGFTILALAFVVAAVMKVAQGSGTVSMMTTVAIFAGLGVSAEMLGCHLVYLAAAIGAGSLVGSWMNDSGFWIFARMGVLSEVETLKTWTILLSCLGTVAFVITIVLSRIMPLMSFVE